MTAFSPSTTTPHRRLRHLGPRCRLLLWIALASGLLGPAGTSTARAKATGFRLEQAVQLKDAASGFIYPSAATSDAAGNLLVTAGLSLYRFDETGRLVTSQPLGSAGEDPSAEPPPVRLISDIAASADGTVFIADPAFNRVVAIDASGTRYLAFGRPDGQPEDSPGGLHGPTALAASSNQLLVADENGIERFDLRSGFVNRLAPAPHAQAVAAYPGQKVIAALPLTQEIVAFDEAGRRSVLPPLATPGRLGPALPEAFALSADGGLLAVTPEEDRIDSLRPDLRRVAWTCRIGDYGRPTYIGVGPRGPLSLTVTGTLLVFAPASAPGFRCGPPIALKLKQLRKRPGVRLRFAANQPVVLRVELESPGPSGTLIAERDRARRSGSLNLTQALKRRRLLKRKVRLSVSAEHGTRSRISQLVIRPRR